MLLFVTPNIGTTVNPSAAACKCNSLCVWLCSFMCMCFIWVNVYKNSPSLHISANPFSAWQKDQ